MLFITKLHQKTINNLNKCLIISKHNYYHLLRPPPPRLQDNYFLQTLSQNNSINRRTKTATQTKDSSHVFKPVYKFPYIRVLALINKIKLHCTILTAITLPGSLLLNQLDYFTTHEAVLASSLGVAACLPLYTVGILVTRFVGYVYIDAESMVRISYIDFWGRRKSIETQINDIIPLSEVPRSFTDGIYSKIRRFSFNKNDLKISLKYGIVLDQVGYKKVFLG